nr:YwmB family TATA-box binding protein [Alkalibaculum sporogenes]
MLFIAITKEQILRSFAKETQVDLLNAFQNTGATIEEIDIHIDFESQIDIEKVNYALKNNNNNLKDTNNNLKDTNRVITLNKINKNDIESVDIKINKIDGLSYYEEVVDQLKDARIESQTFLKLTGTIDEEISESRMIKIAKTIYEDTGAAFVEGGFVRNSFLSTSGYTSSIPTHIKTGGNKININICLKYDHNEKKTKLILATPLIYGDY